MTQVQISNDNEFVCLLDLSKKNVDFYKFNQWNMISKDESITQIITLKLLKSKTNECYSKINLVLYKAYEILEDNPSDNNILINSKIVNNNIISKSNLQKSFIFSQGDNKKMKNNNDFYNLYTKDNYAFFNGIQKKINYRISYILKYIKDTLTKGINLFIVLLPCEYQYLLLIHDLLDNINMRKLIIENIIVDEQDNISTNELGKFYKFENVSELNDNENNVKEKYVEIDSFQSFSKNNSVNTNISSVFINEGKGKNFLYNSCINDNILYKTKRTELNIERLKKINDKNNIIRLFELLDKFSLYELEDFEN